LSRTSGSRPFAPWSRSKALRISSEAFQAFLLEHPRVAIGMLQALTARLREVEQRIDAWMGS